MLKKCINHPLCEVGTIEVKSTVTKCPKCGGPLKKEKRKKIRPKKKRKKNRRQSKPNNNKCHRR